MHLVLRCIFYNVTTKCDVLDLSIRGLSYFYASCDGIRELLYTRIPIQLVVGMCPFTSGQFCVGVEVGPHVFLFAIFFCRNCWVVEVVGFADLQLRFL